MGMPEIKRKSPEDHRRAIAHRARQERIYQGLTQKDLAAKANVSLQAVGDLERSGQSTLATFVRIFSALGLDDVLDTLTYRPSVSPVAMLRSSREPQRFRRSGS
jgi:transcriptional regulator with XRE-family HTH domain